MFVCLSGSVSCIMFLYEILIYDVTMHFAVLCALQVLFCTRLFPLVYVVV